MSPDAEADILWNRYRDAVSERMDAERAYYQAAAAELEAKLNTYFAQPGNSHAQAERIADHAALTFSSEKLKLRGELGALEAEIVFLRDRLRVVGRDAPVDS